ncbi:MAG: glycoside hydrolase family 15 protein [Candidatus Woesearchaeota archaeon]
MKRKSLKILKRLQSKNGLFSASALDTSYNKAWIRDNIYCALGLEKHELDRALKTYSALLDIFLKHEYKIDWAIREKPDATHKYIHARYDLQTMEEFWEEWGNKQHDAIGAFLFKVGELENKGIKVLRDINDYRIVQKLIFYLKNIEYWHDPDNGIWEEYEEVHASSVGACVAGLKQLKALFYIPEGLIEKGEETLQRLLPRESETKEVDLALLSLIYPYAVVDEEQRKQILTNVEEKLIKERGVIRYLGDQYYNQDGEAEWTFGFPWLGIIYKELGDQDKYNFYLNKTTQVMNNKGELPELYFANSLIHNENSPLCWSQAMYLAAIA